MSMTQMYNRYTPLHEGSARRRDLCLYNTQHSQETDIHVPFEPAIPANERPQNYGFVREATVIGDLTL